MKILMILAVLMVVAGAALGDPILTVLGVVSLANAGIDALARGHAVRQPILAIPRRRCSCTARAVRVARLR